MFQPRVVAFGWVCPLCRSNGSEQRWHAICAMVEELGHNAVSISACTNGHSVIDDRRIVVPVQVSRGLHGKLRSRYRAFLRRRPSGPLGRASEAKLLANLGRILKAEPDSIVLALGLASFELIDRAYPEAFVLFDALLAEGNALASEAALRRTPARQILAFEARVTGQLEDWLAKRARAISVTTDRDEAWFSTRVGTDHVVLAPNGIHIGDPLERNKIDPNLIVYTGSVSYGPNRIAVEDLAAGVLAKMPDVRLKVTGHVADSDRKRLEIPGRLEFTGFLPELRPTLCEALALVAPLRVGGGSRLKILEALALALPIIASHEAMAGTGAEPGRHYLEAADMEETRERIRQLQTEPELGTQLGLAGRQLATSFDWKYTLAQLRDAVVELGSPVGSAT
jgi:glycosyltransferase involved in cell wall biosynthesis